jgi:Flp pilus assembly pilin Flp
MIAANGSGRGTPTKSERKLKMLLNLICRMDVLLHDRRGIAALEYGIIAAAVLGAVGAAAATLKTDITSLFNVVLTAVTNAT